MSPDPANRDVRICFWVFCVFKGLNYVFWTLSIFLLTISGLNS